MKRIVVHESFPGFNKLYEKNDLTLIEVDKEFIFLDDVQPACIDWEDYFEESDLKDGNEAVVSESIHYLTFAFETEKLPTI